MRREPHPISGVIYEEIGDGKVRVENPKTGVHGVFTWDGKWLEGDLTYADPHMRVYIGGQDLPPGKDRYWGLTPPYESEDAELADVGAGGSMRRLLHTVVGRSMRSGGTTQPLMQKADEGSRCAAAIRSATRLAG